MVAMKIGQLRRMLVALAIGAVAVTAAVGGASMKSSALCDPARSCFTIRAADAHPLPATRLIAPGFAGAL